MKKEDWEKYEKARADLKRKFRRLRWRTRLVWFIYNVIADVLLFTLLAPRTSVPTTWGFAAFSTLLSTIIMFKKIKDWLQIEAEQERLLMNNAPVGKIRLYE